MATEVNLKTTFLEWKDITNSIISEIGDITTLSTDDKTNLVLSVNEVLSELGNVGSLNTTDKTNLVAAINELLTKIGTLTSLTTTAKTNLVLAINEVLTKLGTLTSLNTASKTSAVSAINEVNVNVGSLTSLTTTAKTSAVAAINELDGQVGDLTTLNTTVKTNLVASINELESSVSGFTSELGTIGDLETTENEDLVVAINEVNSNANQNTSNLSEHIVHDYTNMEVNHGRFSSETAKDLTTFSNTGTMIQPYNSSTIAELASEGFIDDNSTNGGAGGALGTETQALLSRLGTSNRRYGYEWYIAEITAGDGIADSVTVSTVDYYPVCANSSAFLGAIGRKITWSAWVKNTTTNGMVLGNSNVTTYVDGILHTWNSTTFNNSSGSNVDGWIHVRQVYTLTDRDYYNFIPAIYANDTDVILVALPSVFYGDVSMGLHKGLL